MTPPSTPPTPPAHSPLPWALYTVQSGPFVYYDEYNKPSYLILDANGIVVGQFDAPNEDSLPLTLSNTRMVLAAVNERDLVLDFLSRLVHALPHQDNLRKELFDLGLEGARLLDRTSWLSPRQRAQGKEGGL